MMRAANTNELIASVDREAIERENAERLRARGSTSYAGECETPAPLCNTELDVIQQALSRVGETVTRYDGRFYPHNTELSLRTVPGGAIDLVFDNEGKLLSIARRHCVME